jgi:hypothetical protein
MAVSYRLTHRHTYKQPGRRFEYLAVLLTLRDADEGRQYFERVTDVDCAALWPAFIMMFAMAGITSVLAMLAAQRPSR